MTKCEICKTNYQNDGFVHNCIGCGKSICEFCSEYGRASKLEYPDHNDNIIRIICNECLNDNSHLKGLLSELTHSKINIKILNNAIKNEISRLENN